MPIQRGSVAIDFSAAIVVVDVTAFFGGGLGANGPAIVIDKAHLPNRANVIRTVFVPETRLFSIRTSVNCADNSAGGRTVCFDPLWEEFEKDTVVALSKIACATRDFSSKSQSSD